MSGLLTPSWHETKTGPDGSYKIRGLTGFEWFDLQETIAARDGAEWLNLAKAGRGELKRSEYQFVLEHGVLAWKDLAPEAITGDPEAAFEPARVAEMCLDHIIEITTEILGRSMLTETQEKNSSSQPRSPETVETSTAQNANGGDTAQA